MDKNKLHVLLLEDNPDDIIIIKRMIRLLKDMEIELTCTDNLATALEILNSGTLVDLVLSDLSLPDSNGLKTFGRIRVAVPDTPVIITSGLNDESVAVKAVALGAQDYIVKGNFDGKILKRAMLYAIERKKLEKERNILLHKLEDKNKILNDVSKQKSQFLANMAHELRSPLNSILLLSGDLSKNASGTLSDNDAFYAQIIHTSGTDLLALIDDILDLAKVESGKMTMFYEDTSPGDVAKKLKDLYERAAQEKGIDFILEQGNGVPDLIYTDRQKLEQIIKNFLSNAIKFTKKGSVKLSFNMTSILPPYVASRFRGQELLEISVTDTGIGIEQDRIEAIFQAFQQEGSNTLHYYGGTGLGLSISLEFTRLLGGEIFVSSDKGKGSVFTLFIPRSQDDAVSKPQDGSDEMDLHKTPSPSITTSETVEKIHDFAEKSVLLLDSDMRSLISQARVLSDIGFTVYKTSGIDLAQQKLDEIKNIDLIITEITFSDGDAYPFIETLKSESSFSCVPIIAATSTKLSETRDKAIAAGVDEYLTKPYSIEELVSAIRKVLIRN